MQPLRYAIQQQQVATRPAGLEEAGRTLDKRWGWPRAGGRGPGRAGAGGGQRFLRASRTSASAS